jgi:hypothetical protein
MPSLGWTDPAGTNAPAPRLTQGTRVRLTVAGRGRLVGNVAELRHDTLVLERRRNGEIERLSLLRADVRGTEVSERRSRKTTGALIGMLAGLAGGVALGVAGGDDCAPDPGPASFVNLGASLSSSLCVGRGEGAFLAAFVLMPLGGAVGAAVAPGEKWRRVDSPRLSVGVTAPRGGGAAARVSVRF